MSLYEPEAANPTAEAVTGITIEPLAFTIAGTVKLEESQVLPFAAATCVIVICAPVLFCNERLLVTVWPGAAGIIRLEGVTGVELGPPCPGANVTLIVAATVVLPMGVNVTVP
jgi:hypothetical protein